MMMAFLRSNVQTIIRESIVWSSRMARKKAFEIIEIMMLKYGNMLSAGEERVIIIMGHGSKKCIAMCTAIVLVR